MWFLSLVCLYIYYGVMWSLQPVGNSQSRNFIKSELSDSKSNVSTNGLSVCSLQVVVNALVQAIPAIFNVLLVCLVFWLIFSIMGVNLFGGRFSSCVDENGDNVNFSIVSSRNDCDHLGPIYNYTWFTPKVNFDNCLIAYLALFQVVSNC
jgi:hypothetical protein